MSHSGSSKTREFSPQAFEPGGSGSHPAPIKPSGTPDDNTVISDRSPGGRALGVPPHPFELGQLSAGDRLCHFELLEYVGGGGMGAVFRARDTMLDREVAVKVLSRAQGADEETRRRFQVEAQSAARLDHQNIARVYYVGEDQGLNFIVFEFVQGVNIRELVERQGPLSLSDAVSYTLQVAEALAHASGRQVVHRDIKPSNIIVDDQGRAKLVDMGLARLHATSNNDDLTASGVTLGTFDYISPEQARDPRTADVRSDMYSLGCTLYYMLSGRPPFPDGTVLQKLLQHQADDVPDLRQFNPQVPDEITEFMRRMLAKDPRRRFQEPGELIAELLLLAGRLNLRPVTAGHFWIAPDDQRARWWERHLPWIIPAVALVLIAAGVEWFSRPTSEYALVENRVESRDDIHSESRGGANGRSDSRAQGTNRGANEPRTPQSSATESPASAVGRRANDDRPAFDGSAPREGRTAVENQRLFDNRLSTERAAPNVASSIERPFAADEVPGAHRAGDLPTETAGEPATFEPSNGIDFGIGESPFVREANETATTRSGRALSPAAPATSFYPEPPAVRLPAPAGAFVVIGSDGQRRTASSLKEACAAAKNNDIIELQFSGARDVEPIELNNLKLTIRAGEDYRPLLVFRPPTPVASGLARSMMTISGGRLMLHNVGILFDIPRRAAAEGWSLFELRQVERVRLDFCTLTVRNAADDGSALHQSVSFFDVLAAPGAGMTMKMPDAPPVQVLDLELQDCIIRGQAAVVRSTEAQPLNLDWDNGLLAVTEPLFLAEGTTTSPPSSESALLALKHVTAVVLGGLVRMTATTDRPYVLKTKVSCTNSFLLSRGAPLIEQQGPQRVQVLKQQFEWSGEKNFCQGFSSFWQLTDLTMPATQSISLSQWQVHWGGGDSLIPQRNTPIWKQPAAADRSVDTMRREDFVLAERSRSDNPFEASNRGDVGSDWRSLPDLPPEPAAVPSIPRDMLHGPTRGLPTR